MNIDSIDTNETIVGIVTEAFNATPPAEVAANVLCGAWDKEEVVKALGSAGVSEKIIRAVANEMEKFEEEQKED